MVSETYSFIPRVTRQPVITVWMLAGGEAQVCVVVVVCLCVGMQFPQVQTGTWPLNSVRIPTSPRSLQGKERKVSLKKKTNQKTTTIGNPAFKKSGRRKGFFLLLSCAVIFLVVFTIFIFFRLGML